MTALDTDVLTELFAGNAVYEQRIGAVAGEVVRGWLNAVRQAEAGKGRMSLEFAFERLQESLTVMVPFALLPYTAAADALVRQWRAAKIRVGTNDLRIAAICVVHGATLVTRNARDYAQVPGLTFDVWN
ncbi:type II toxin-antitoxin system VapC family toxin [Gemmata sp. JC717]|uniref:type II toxin-antitoxin system VapC family toxin n=1 Tax=Gemmata algarum TaxID=2975278 RepID=UPI0021BA40D9|nr:type II toxin-antitoxin system VapC family toxin [Gemmata algarum]MDY3553968.1 type II toxin-antitoxin system VapC family toxin [Gemmata algarum]